MWLLNFTFFTQSPPCLCYFITGWEYALFTGNMHSNCYILFYILYMLLDILYFQTFNFSSSKVKIIRSHDRSKVIQTYEGNVRLHSSAAASKLSGWCCPGAMYFNVLMHVLEKAIISSQRMLLYHQILLSCDISATSADCWRLPHSNHSTPKAAPSAQQRPCTNVFTKWKDMDMDSNTVVWASKI